MNTTYQRFLSAFAVTTVAGTLLAGGIAASNAADKGTKPAAIVETVRVTPQPIQSFAPMLKQVLPSVAQVATEAKPRNTSMRGGPEMDNPMFQWFFGDERAQQFRRRPMPVEPQRGAGSAVVVSEDGYLLTNNHVVEGADTVRVKLQDGRQFTAKVVGTDPQTDLAVIKIEAKGLPAISLADSDAAEVGDVVLAVGNSFGLGQTVTTGIISAKGRVALGLDYEDFLQTDAAINPGNSGGALVDSQGRLLGINTAIQSKSGGNEGVGFAIPVNLARTVMDGLLKDGRVTRAYIGVLIQDISPALASQFKLDSTQGALVGEVKEDGPAAKAGVESGDVILEVDGKQVRDSRQLRLLVASQTPGSTIPMKVLRDGKTKTLKLKLQALDSKNSLARNQSPATAPEGTLNGVEVADLNRANRARFGIPESIEGALVVGVEEGSPSYEANLRPGDVILEINRKPVTSAEDAVKLTEKTEDQTSLLRVWSKNGSRYIVVDESKK